MTTATKLSFIHRFEPATEQGLPPLLLLHGTGGDENDLIDLGRIVSPGSALLSPRGKVLEGGMPRFFRRLKEGVFDEDDVRKRANELADFVEEARKEYGLPAPIALGFSNGANIAAATLLLRPEALAGAVLLRAMVPLAQPPAADLSGKAGAHPVRFDGPHRAGGERHASGAAVAACRCECRAQNLAGKSRPVAGRCHVDARLSCEATRA